MIRRYFRSSLHLAVLLALLLAFAPARTSYAQATGGDAPAPHVEPEGIFSLVLHSADFVTVIILLLSVMGLTLIIQGFIKNRASIFMPEASTAHIRELIGQKKFKELIEYTETDPSFVSKALNPALKRAPSFSSMKEAMETAIGEQTAEQFRKLEYLNIIGNLGPLLGLLGTVLGMIVAFSAMKAAGGSANPGDLAAGISKALCHTFEGLALAVPCLASFGVLRTIVDRLTVRGALVSEELLLMVKPAEKPAGAAAAQRPAAGVPQPQAPRKVPAAPMPAPAPAPM